MRKTLVRGRWLISDPSLLPADGVIANGAVVVDGDTIEDVGEYDALKSRAPDAQEIGSQSHIVMPGLVNAHDHGRGIAAYRVGMADDYLEPWILDFWCLHPLDVRLDTLYSAIRLLKSGVTTVLHSGYSRDWSQPEAENHAVLDGYLESGMRVAFAPFAMDQNTFVYQDDETFLASLPQQLAETLTRTLDRMSPPQDYDWAENTRALAARYSDNSRVRILCGPTGPEWCSPAMLRQSAELAEEANIGLHMHCLESPIQRDYFKRISGKTCVEYINDFGVLGSKTSLAHCTWFGERDIELCAETGTSACHNASSNMRLRNGIAPITRMIECGVNVGIGMDSFSLNSDDDFLREMRLVENLHHMPRGGIGHQPCPSAADVFRMATTGGARASTFGDEIGALLPGRKADLVLLDQDALAEPYLDPRVPALDAILRLGNASHVDTVMVGGEVCVAGGQYQRGDEAEIGAQLAELAKHDPPDHLARLFEAAQAVRPYVAEFFERNYPPTEVEPYYTVNGSR